MVGFLAAVLVLAQLCDDEGLFRAAGAAMAQVGRRAIPERLLAWVFVIGAVTTAVLSLDATVVLLTPVVLATTRALRVPARPHAYATAHLANTASLLLPVSNLTNLLAFTAAGLSFLHFTAVMAPSWLAAVAVEFLLLRWLFAQRSSSETTTRAGTGSGAGAGIRVGGAVPDVGRVRRHVTARLLACVGCARRRRGPRGARACPSRDIHAPMASAADVPFLVFVLCLGVVVKGLMLHGLESAMRGMLPGGDALLALLGIAAVAAVLSNIVNNLPAVLVLLPLVTASGPAAVLAMLLGVNIGPNLTYVGSLANLLWRSVVRRDIPAGFREFSRVGLITTPSRSSSPCLACGSASDCSAFSPSRRAYGLWTTITGSPAISEFRCMGYGVNRRLSSHSPFVRREE